MENDLISSQPVGTVGELLCSHCEKSVSKLQSALDQEIGLKRVLSRRPPPAALGG